MIGLLVYILVLFLICGLLMWCVQLLPLGHPFNVIAQAIIAVILILVLIDILLNGRLFGLPRFSP